MLELSFYFPLFYYSILSIVSRYFILRDSCYALRSRHFVLLRSMLILIDYFLPRSEMSMSYLLTSLISSLFFIASLFIAFRVVLHTYYYSASLLTSSKQSTSRALSFLQYLISVVYSSRVLSLPCRRLM